MVSRTMSPQTFRSGPQFTFDTTTHMMGADRAGVMLLGNGRKPGDNQSMCKHCEELLVDLVNGRAYGYRPVQVDSEGSIRWRRRTRDRCIRGRRMFVMSTMMMMMTMI